MIHWLIQSFQAHPDLASGALPEELLSSKEIDLFSQLRKEKRQREWLLGRWTAKKLLQAILKDTTGEYIPLSNLRIFNLQNGAPYLADRWPLSLSISHCHEYAFCAVSQGLSWSVGVDIERIEPRAPGFTKEYFTGLEIQQVCQVPAEAHDCMLAFTWSAKEAVLKALQLGLTVDTRAVTCLAKPGIFPQHGWLPFEIRLDLTWIERCMRARQNTFLSFDDIPCLSGWWQIRGDYVLTLVARRITG